MPACFFLFRGFTGFLSHYFHPPYPSKMHFPKRVAGEARTKRIATDAIRTTRPPVDAWGAERIVDARRSGMNALASRFEMRGA